MRPCQALHGSWGFAAETVSFLVAGVAHFCISFNTTGQSEQIFLGGGRLMNFRELPLTPPQKCLVPL